MPGKKDKKNASPKKKQQTPRKENVTAESDLRQSFDNALKRVREIGKKYELPKK
jgi:hypothetical protein